MNVTLAIDPGLDGALGWVGEQCGAERMPTLDSRPDLTRIRARLVELNPSLVLIEKPEAMPRQGSQTYLKVGVNWGLIVGMMTEMGIPMSEVRAVTWKTRMGIALKGKEVTPKQRKERAIAEARKLFPGVELKASSRCTTYHDGMAEALLLAEYGRRTVSN